MKMESNKNLGEETTVYTRHGKASEMNGLTVHSLGWYKGLSKVNCIASKYREASMEKKRRRRRQQARDNNVYTGKKGEKEGKP